MPKKFIEEFKKFAVRGNVMDMAVGVIIGGAFGKIVSSIVNDMMMPLLGVLIGGFDFKSLKWVLSPAMMDGDKMVKAEVALLYGNFIQNVFDFMVIALSIFLFMKVVNRISQKLLKQEEVAKEEETKVEAKPEEAEVPEEPKKPTTEELLSEIRDLLKNKNAE